MRCILETRRKRDVSLAPFPDPREPRYAFSDFVAGEWMQVDGIPPCVFAGERIGFGELFVFGGESLQGETGGVVVEGGDDVGGSEVWGY